MSEARSIRGYELPVCGRCGLKERACVCEVLDALAMPDVRTRVLLVLHREEARRTTNTGRLAALALGAEIHVPGVDPELGPTEGLLLDPVAARVLRPTDAGSTLVAVDASWRQARRMMRKHRVLRTMTRVRLPEGPPGRYRLRKAPVPGQQLSTLEAIARAMRLLEGDAVADPLVALFDEAQARMLAVRGVT